MFPEIWAVGKLLVITSNGWGLEENIFFDGIPFVWKITLFYAFLVVCCHGTVYSPVLELLQTSHASL